MTLATIARARACALLFAVASSMALCAASAQAATTCTQYAAPYGSDSAAGTAAAPYRTPQRLIDALQAGATGCLRGGTYSYSSLRFNRGGAAGSPITLTSYPGERAKLLGGTIYVPAGSSHVTLDGLDIDARLAGSSISIQLFGDYNRLLNSDVTNAHLGESCITLSDYGAGSPTIVGAELRGNHIHGCGLVSDGAHDHGIYVANSRGHVVSDNVIEDIWAGWGIQLWTTSIDGVFERNTIRASSQQISSDTDGGVVIVAGDGTHGNTFTSNTLVGNGSNYVVDSYAAASDAARFSGNCIVSSGASLWEDTSMNAGGNKVVTSESSCGTVAPPPPPPPPPPPGSWVTITSLDGEPDAVPPANGATLFEDWICPTAGASSDTRQVTFTLDDQQFYDAWSIPWVGTCWTIWPGWHKLQVETDRGATRTMYFSQMATRDGLPS